MTINYPNSFQAIKNLDKEELLDLMVAYDEYIFSACESGIMDTGWQPVCIGEFYDYEYHDVWKSVGNFDYMYDNHDHINNECQLEVAYKRLEEIDTELKHEYDRYGDTVHASQLECEYERIEDAICKFEESEGLN